MSPHLCYTLFYTSCHGFGGCITGVAMVNYACCYGYYKEYRNSTILWLLQTLLEFCRLEHTCCYGYYIRCYVSTGWCRSGSLTVWTSRSWCLTSGYNTGTLVTTGRSRTCPCRPRRTTSTRTSTTPWRTPTSTSTPATSPSSSAVASKYHLERVEGFWLENTDKWKGIFQSGKSQGILKRLKKSGKLTQNTEKSKFQTNVIDYFSDI